MGIMQTAYRTYESYKHLAGVIIDGDKEPLAPLSHMFTNAQLEITLSGDGEFLRADEIKDNTKTLIPATIESANRTGDNTKAHPLSDQIRYIAPHGGDKYEAYIKNLAAWEQSPFSHPKVEAVLSYIRSGTLVGDLVRCGVLPVAESDVKGSKYDKYFVRWRVLLVTDNNKTACWEDTSLFDSFAKYYKYLCADNDRDFCMITGEQDMVCEMHPKGVVSASYGAKLLSANDDSGFTYRGRFSKSGEAYSVGYTASQMAHNALHWVVANQGVMMGGRTFICWNPEGKDVPVDAIFGKPSEADLDYEKYKKRLSETVKGYKNSLRDTDDVVIASLDAATTGRLSVTYYNELKASAFLQRIEKWYDTLCWDAMFQGVTSPPIRRIATCAFGIDRGRFIDLDDKILCEHVQRLLNCVVNGAAIPEDVVRALAVKASAPLAYSKGNREILLSTACAVIRKHKNDKLNKEEWKLALDTENKGRSYLFGRLLAVAENVERSTYDRSEKRETNAIRMQSVFAQRPLQTWRIIDEKLNPYFARLNPGLRSYYKGLVGEIVDKLSTENTEELNKRLDDTYLLGYYHQRSAFYQKKETRIEEDLENEHTED